MDWEPVPVGTLPPAALTARGADHDLDFAAGDSVEVALGHSVSLCQSGISSVAGGDFATLRSLGAPVLISIPTDAAVLTHLVRGAVPGPAKLRALWLGFARSSMATWQRTCLVTRGSSDLGGLVTGFGTRRGSSIPRRGILLARPPGSFCRSAATAPRLLWHSVCGSGRRVRPRPRLPCQPSRGSAAVVGSSTIRSRATRRTSTGVCTLSASAARWPPSRGRLRASARRSARPSLALSRRWREAAWALRALHASPAGIADARRPRAPPR